METEMTQRVDKFRVLCNEGCSKEYKDTTILKKCVDYCNVGAKELGEAFAKDKIA
ncbi:hypothetical protein C2845_PM17G10390 [Panicum miliaceum]|uniref:Uncharacterized protein n=1 Tax=Panicum miliaceum TaxID=4540 RepID=A0A3L6Q1Z9_PANMI|nr:hypothetical protein C2845_PM17G10390 [Panicum miliaceum]